MTTDADIRAAITAQLADAYRYLIASVLRAASSVADRDPTATLTVAIDEALNQPAIENLFNAAYAAWPAVWMDHEARFERAYAAAVKIGKDGNRARQLADAAGLDVL